MTFQETVCPLRWHSPGENHWTTFAENVWTTFAENRWTTLGRILTQGAAQRLPLVVGKEPRKPG